MRKNKIKLLTCQGRASRLFFTRVRLPVYSLQLEMKMRGDVRGKVKCEL